MKQYCTRYIFIYLIISVLICSCDDEKAITESDDETNDPEPVISVAGQVMPYPGTSINTVGLFNIYLDKPLQVDNYAPFAITAITDSGWVLEIPDITKNSNFDSLAFTAFWGGHPMYSFLILGWSDNDGDDRYDPISGEIVALSHVGKDTFNVSYLYYVDNDGDSLLNNWWSNGDNLININNNWLIKDLSTASPISNWTYRNNINNVSSMRAVPGGYYSNTSGYTIDISTSDISCSTGSVPRPKVTLFYDDLTTGVYFSLKTWVSMYDQTSNISGNGDVAGLTIVGTINNRIKGWVIYEEIGGFSADDTARVYGTFDVPFCQ